MPTYEYACQSCGGEFEYFQPISEAPKTTCETCGGALTKLLSAGSGLIFRGSGFYITDYKGGDKPGEKKGEGSGEKKSDEGGGESRSSGSGESGKSAPPAAESGSSPKDSAKSKAKDS